MGLDMYLYSVKRDVNLENVRQYPVEEIMYWRKANQIRRWFEEYLDNPIENCEYTRVPKEKLEELLRTCRIVLNERDRAEELLPTSEGFFFGGTEYDNWYFKQVQETVEQIEKILKETNWEEKEVLYFEWW